MNSYRHSTVAELVGRFKSHPGRRGSTGPSAAHRTASTRPWQIPFKALDDRSGPSIATLHVVAPAPASFVSSGDSSSDHQLQVGTDHGVLVVRSVNQADRPDPLLDRTIDDTSEPHGLRVRADLHVPDDLDPSTTMVQCHDGQLDIRIAMAATNAAPHQVSPTP